MGSSVPSEDPFGGDEDPFGGDEGGFDAPEPASDKPFDDTPFDAGVEASEEESPEKYIQQLSGKLGQSLRAYANDSGQPDLDLEKFAINSVISATHTGEMDQNDQNDIISKIKNSGSNGNEFDAPDGGGEDEGGGVVDDGGDGIDLEDIEMEEGFNPNGNGKTVFQEMTLGVKDGGMEENKYLNLENTKKSSIFVDNIKTMVRESLTETRTVLPTTKPVVMPKKKPSKRSSPWTITPKPNPRPKALHEDGEMEQIIVMGKIPTPTAEEVTLKFKVGANNPEIAKFVNQNIAQADNAEIASLNDVPYEYTYKTQEPIEGSYYAITVSFNGDAFDGGEFMSYGDNSTPIIEKI
jgi:hypothetical protein